jgi:hypothetical protein
MVNDDFPDDLLEDVKHSYTYFVEKSIYYLKMRATTNNTSNTNTNEDKDEVSANDEEESNDNEESSANELSANEESSDNEISDNERSEQEQESSANEDEEEELSANDELSDNEKEQPVISAINNKYKIKPQPQSTTIYKKAKKNTQSKGVDNIEQLPLDWFTKVRQTQKQHTIIPRKKDYNK